MASPASETTAPAMASTMKWLAVITTEKSMATGQSRPATTMESRRLPTQATMKPSSMAQPKWRLGTAA